MGKLTISNIATIDFPRIKHNGNYYMVSFKEETDKHYILSISGSMGDSTAKRMKYGFPIFIGRTIFEDGSIIVILKNDNGNTFNIFRCTVDFLECRDALFNEIIEKCVKYLN